MDVYAVGVLLFHMLTGRRPFNNVPVVQRLSAKAPLPTSVVSHLDPRWDAIVGRCLELNPAARFQNLGELKVALSRAMPVPMPGMT
jgi:serine/threonine protein kinase